MKKKIAPSLPSVSTKLLTFHAYILTREKIHEYKIKKYMNV